MAKAAALVSVLVLLAVSGITHAHNKPPINVEGDVYCDPCRFQFQSKLSQKLEGAVVRLVCKNVTTTAVTYTVEGITDCNGHYSLPVEGNHEDDICHVQLVKSPRNDCIDLMPSLESAPIVCSQNSGLVSSTRYANPLGFMTKHIIGGCKEALDEMGFIPYEN